MSKPFLYAVCPHCEHPNVHVYNGSIAPHTVGLASDTQCSGSNLVAHETHAEPINRHTAAFREALEKQLAGLDLEKRPVQPEAPDVAPAFTYWRFSGFGFLAAPIDRGAFHIIDCHGNNYGSWMSVEEFRKRQGAGVIADWQALGKAHLNIVCDR